MGGGLYTQSYTYNDDAVFRIHIRVNGGKGKRQNRKEKKKTKKNKKTRGYRKERLDFLMVSSVQLLLDGWACFLVGYTAEEPFISGAASFDCWFHQRKKKENKKEATRTEKKW